jgi:hypothetical protein
MVTKQIACRLPNEGKLMVQHSFSKCGTEVMNHSSIHY